MRRVAGGLVAAGIVGAMVLTADAALGASIPLSVSPVALDRVNGSVRAVGRLHYLGGLVVKSRAEAFGGLSGLSVSPDGRLTAVSDRGHWFRARIVRDGAGRLADLADGALAPLRDAQARPLEGNWRDAEALERLPGGDWLVSFEQRHRVWRYAAETGGLEGPATRVSIPKAAERAPGNGGMELIAPLADGRILMLAESLKRADGAHAGWLVGERAAALGYRPAPGFKPTDAATLPNGDLLILSRSFSLLGGFRARLELIPAAAIRPGAVLQGALLAQLAPPLTVDNFEGVAVVPSEDGGTLAYILSDDNFNFLQRTLLMLFRLDES